MRAEGSTGLADAAVGAFDATLTGGAGGADAGADFASGAAEGAGAGDGTDGAAETAGADGAAVGDDVEITGVACAGGLGASGLGGAGLGSSGLVRGSGGRAGSGSGDACDFATGSSSPACGRLRNTALSVGNCGKGGGARNPGAR